MKAADTAEMRTPRMDDVARHAGVAIGTVSNVLNHPEKVRPTTRERVQRSISELGFVPNRAARLLAAGTSATIGFVVTDLSNSFFLDMSRGAEREAASRSMNVLLANSDVDPHRERNYLELFAEERMAGVLLAPVANSYSTGTGSRSLTLPTVLLNSEPTEDACTVGVDEELGGYLATEHLISLGRRRIVFAGDPEFAAPVAHRYEGAQRAAREAGGIELELLRTPEIQAEQGRTLGRALLLRSGHEQPDGVVASSDLLALGIMQALLTDGRLRIPQDVSITGYDDNRATWHSEIPITTIAQPGEEMGAVATRLLMDEIDDGPTHVHTHTVLEPILLPRRSSRADNH